MSILLNRKYGSRLECLYYILKSCYATHANNYFKSNDIKFDNNNEFNVHKFCKNLSNSLGINFCPYLNNPLDLSKCYATQSIDSDTTKSKAVSDVLNSLIALGFISKNNKGFKITNLGINWCNTSFDSDLWIKIALTGVLSYGPLIGFLHKLNEDKLNVINIKDYFISYPDTNESILWNGCNVTLSTGSTKDSNTRTRSRIVSWCISTGLLKPINLKQSNNLPHINTRNLINQKRLNQSKFKKTSLFNAVVSKKLFVNNPLSYEHLLKDIKSLRERNGKDLREATLNFKPLILNRRFVLIYVLNRCSEENTSLNISKFIKIIEKYPDKFLPNTDDAESIISIESDICYLAGIPFNIDNEYLIPLTTVNKNVLIDNAPKNIVDLAEKIFLEVKNDL